MSDEIAIKVDHVSKNFVLPHEKISSIKSAFTSLYRKKDKTRETQHALKDISFEIKKGEFFGIVGRNGSGKSTMLKILAGIYQPTNGNITTTGKLVPFIELGVGFNPELTGRENVYLNGAMLGFSRKEIESMYEDIVEFAELERFMDQKLKNYSSGMQVRLAFSMATRSEADILLVDEVLAVGDSAFQRKCFRYFKQLKAAHKTVVFVTHDMNAVREYCDRGVFIEDSELVKAGKPDEIAKLYEQLFMDDDGSGRGIRSTTRWGDGTLKATKVGIKQEQSEAVLSIDFKANKDCEDPIVGFIIKGLDGAALIGTNTMIHEHKLPAMEAGEQRSISWRFDKVLADGDYICTVAIQYDSGLSTGDWWEDAARLRIKKAHRSPYIVDPVIKVTSV